ncbi:GSCFA domain-containing protein [Zhouia sp. PK063]|uniref:GSCFA domain-containing protein n=1 Tax=Zhouia sp. PK063 TaxID=3373602 RepID=UPI0037A09504
MIPLQTQLSIPKSLNTINYQSKIALLGSCFVDNIGDKLSYFKFNTLVNPFGILFHPKAIHSLLEKVVKGEHFIEEDVFYFNEKWQSYAVHSDLSRASKEEILEVLNTSLLGAYEYLNKATHVIITLGTAWGYEILENNKFVANCHKVPQKNFKKRLFDVKEIYSLLHNIIHLIQGINPSIMIVFTISPVRHIKDGIIENQRSKANLITAVHQVLNDNVEYFPSYEIMMDELRDYRFYANDLIHPNALAVQYIWEKFKNACINTSCYEDMEEVDKIQKSLAHKPFNENSVSHQKFLKNLNEKIAYLEAKNPAIRF